MKFDLKESTVTRAPGMPVIKVIGLGGGGNNAVDFMLKSEVEGVDFICANTDAQALARSEAPIRIQIGQNGLGAGANPDRGREAAEEDIEQIKEHIKDADMLFITAGMGGGTGTGSAPVVAKLAKELGILTVGVVSKPFSFERRDAVASKGIEELSSYVDSLITVPNDKLMEVLGKDFVFAKAFEHANEILNNAVQGISELVTMPGLMNVDFEDLRTVMSENGLGMMGVGVASGEDRARKAVEKAISNPLLDDIEVSNARGLLVNVSCGMDLTMGEYNVVGEVIKSITEEDATVIIGTSINEDMNGELRVTVVATGLKDSKKPEAIKPNMTGVKATKDAVENVVKEEISPAEPFGQPEPVRERLAVNAGMRSGSTTDSNYLDIPAFLRQQAD